MKHVHRIVTAALLALALGPAGATALRPGTAPAPNSKSPPATLPAAAAAEAPTLISGQVSAIDRARRTVTISGRKVEWHGARLQVFRSAGGRASLDALQPGTRVRFALEPGSGEGRKIVLVYIEAAQ